MWRRFRQLLISSQRLPDSVYAELVDIAYASTIALFVMTFTMGGIGAVIAARNGDAILIFLTVAGVMASLARVAVVRAFRRLTPPPRDLAGAKLWERRYAIGSYVFAATLGLFNARAMSFGDPITAMFVTGLIFGYGAGVVTRLAVRPLICFRCLALSVLPTGIGFLIHAASQPDLSLALIFVAQGFLIVSFAVTSLQTVVHFYQTTLQQLLAKRDLVILAGQDALTGLPNRTLLNARLNEGLARLREGELLACHYLDLDLFKNVNDKLGHLAGDAILQAVAERLTSILRVGDTVARIGGDEFVVLQNGLRSADEARLLAHRIVRSISAPYLHHGEDIRIGASIGVALAPRDGTDLQALTSCADAALYEAKRQGRDSVVVCGDAPSREGAISAA